MPCPPVLLVARQAVSRQMRTRKTTQVQPAPQTAGDAKEQEIRDAWLLTDLHSKKVARLYIPDIRPGLSTIKRTGKE